MITFEKVYVSNVIKKESLWNLGGGVEYDI